MHADVFKQLAEHLKKHRCETTEMHHRFGAAAPLKIGNFTLLKNHKIQMGLSKKLQLQKTGPYEIIETPTDVTYKIKHHETGEEVTSHRNNLVPFFPKEFSLARLVDKYYKRPHLPPQLSENSQNKPPHLKSVSFSPNEPQSQTFNSMDEPVIIESNTNEYFDSSPHHRPSQSLHSSPLQELAPNTNFNTRSSNRSFTQPNLTSKRSSRLRKQPRKDYRTFIKEKDISNHFQTNYSDDSD